MDHISHRIRSPRKRAAVNKAFAAADQHYLPPTEMFRVITEREEAVVMMTWNQFTEVIWSLVADLEGKPHVAGTPDDIDNQ